LIKQSSWFPAGVAAGGSSESTTETTTVTRTQTKTETETVTDTKTIKAKPAGPSGTIEGEGTFLVGKDIAAGLYRAPAPSTGNCYWARLHDLNGGLNSIINNNNNSGPTVINVASTDYAVETSGCETFQRVR
jgi:hypothetical protein